MNQVKIVPAPLKLTVDWRGSVSFKLEVTNKEDGLPIDLSSAAQIWFTVKNSINDADNAAIIQVTKTGGGISVSGTDHNIVTVAANDIGDDLPNAAAACVCDCKVKLADGYIQVLAKGSLNIVPVITQSIA